MGTDLSVINAARVSFDKKTTTLKDKDYGLIKYLSAHEHWTPFAHTAITLRISAPLFVARQLGKSNVGFVWNEVSRRYVDFTPDLFIIDAWRSRPVNVKQGSSEKDVIHLSKEMLLLVETHRDMTFQLYQGLLREGVCPEQARTILPQSMMTQWIWTGNLQSFARVCNLRCKLDTQKETRDVANLIDTEVAKLFPVSWRELRHGGRS